MKPWLDDNRYRLWITKLSTTNNRTLAWLKFAHPEWSRYNELKKNLSNIIVENSSCTSCKIDLRPWKSCVGRGPNAVQIYAITISYCVCNIKIYMEATGEEMHQAHEAVDEAIESGRMAEFRPRSAKSLPSKPDDVSEQDVMDAIRQGNKIQAIKLYRQMTGMGLKESKAAVEELISDRTGRGSIKPSKAVERDIVTALRNGNKIQAVKLYRQMSGMGLKESKAAVEALQRELGL